MGGQEARHALAEMIGGCLLRDGFYAWGNGDRNPHCARSNAEINGNCLFHDFEEMLADICESAIEDRWSIAALLLGMDFPEGWPESIIKDDEGHREA